MARVIDKAKKEKLFKNHVIVFGEREYQMRRVDEKELLKLRFKNEPGVVFKQTIDEEVQLWYAPLLDRRVKTTSINWLRHYCATEKECCMRLSPEPEPKGCRAVLELTPAGYRHHGVEWRVAVKMGFRIEKYDFILVALETFGCDENGFKCMKCSNCAYNPTPPPQRERELPPDTRRKVSKRADDADTLDDNERKRLDEMKRLVQKMMK